MAYNGGYPAGPNRAYPNNAAQRPPPEPQGYGAPATPGPHGYSRQQYDEYNNGYNHDGNGGGHGQQFDSYQQDPSYGRPPPSHMQPRGGGRGRPVPQGRGGEMFNRRPMPPTNAHAGGNHGGRGRGGPPGGYGPGGPGRRPDPYQGHLDYAGAQQPSHGPSRNPSFDQEQQMMGQMANMNLNNGRGPPAHAGRANYDTPTSPAYQQHHPHEGRFDPQAQRPSSQQDQGRVQSWGDYGHYGDGYGGQQQGGRQQNGPSGDFGPPARSMTMPNRDFGPPERSMTMPTNNYGAGRDAMPPLQRNETMQYNAAPAMHNVPARPSTATGQWQSPGSERPGGFDGGQDYQYHAATPSGNAYDAYYENSHPGHQAYNAGGHQSHHSQPNFNVIDQQIGRGSFDQSMRPALEQPQPGAQQTAQLAHAQSQSDLRQPQAAVFEMAGDIPSVPPMPKIGAFEPPAFDPYSNGPGPHDQGPPRGPSAPPMPPNMGRPSLPSDPILTRPRTSAPYSGSTTSLPAHPAPLRPGTAAPPERSPDSLPSHPAPVRPGLMTNSVVNFNNKPAPVRNYGGVPHSQSAPPQQLRQLPPQQQQQQQQPAPQQAQQPMPQPQALPTKLPEQPVTPQELEQLRMIIKNNPHDQASALRLAKKLIEAATVLIVRLPDPKSRARGRERYVTDAQKILKKLSNNQNGDAMFFMADCLGKGVFGNEPDSKEAFTLYQSAAKIGHAGAAYRTAVCCEIGHEEGGGTRKDPVKAIQWYKRSATLGDPPAMYKLGMILLKGLLGQPRNIREAVGWLKRAADRADTENPHALHELGLLYETAQPNDVIIRDERYALSLFQQAADLGYKFSQFRLGCVYEYGLMGCPVDPRLSIVWYSRAATQAEHQAELALSGWYLTGSEGVLNQSDTEAYLWARKAAVAGLAKAEYAMGYFTEVGIGVPANLEDAKRWYWRAAAQDFPKARERLEDLKRVGKGAPRQRERISRTGMNKQQEGECSVM